MELEAGLKEYFVKVCNFNINFVCRFNPASNEVIIFIHGLACSSDSFSNVFDKDYFPDESLLLIDLIGFGKSSKPEDFSYTMEDQAKIIEKLLSKLSLWNMHIVAHSMGGAIALLLNKEIFSRTISLANIEGNLIAEDCGLLSRGIISVPFNEYKNNLYKKQLLEFKDHQQLRFEQSTPTALYKSAESLVKWSNSGELLNRFRNLTCRKSYFYGEENKEMPVLKKLGPIEKYMIQNSGHAMMTENPKAFYAKLNGFIYQRKNL